MTSSPDLETLLGPDARPRRRWRRVGLALAAVGLLGAGGWYWLGAQAETVAYTTAPASRGDVTITVTATGTAQPTNQVEISSELSGTVRSVEVDNDDAVAAGQVLARLDTSRLEAAIASNEAEVEARKARVQEALATEAQAEADLNRVRTLADRGVSSVQTLETSEAAYARAVAATQSARADVKVAEANLAADRTDLAKSVIVSPISGVVLERAVEVGQIVASSFQAPTLFTIAEDLREMRLEVAIDEADMGVVAVGDRASFGVEAYRDRRFPAEITQLRYAPETVDGVVSYQALLSIDNGALLLRPGMTATAIVTVEELKDVLTVPNAALRYTPEVAVADSRPRRSGLAGMLMPSPPRATPAARPTVAADGTRTVWVLRGGAPEAVSVRTGPTDGLVTVIVEGDLAAGDQLVVDRPEAGS